MVALVTVEQAKSDRRIDGSDSDELVALKLSDAQGIVLDYLKSRADETWTETTVPGPVRSSILLVFGTLWEFREGSGKDAELQDPISPAVVSLLRRLRDPALA